MIHNVKILPQYFSDILEGIKKFELRKNDRDYKVGDIVILNEWEQESGYTGARIALKLSYVVKDCPAYGIKNEYCVFCWDKQEKLVNLPKGWYWTNEADCSGSLHMIDGRAFASYDLYTGELWFNSYDKGVFSHDYYFSIYNLLEVMEIIEKKIPGIEAPYERFAYMDLF